MVTATKGEGPDRSLVSSSPKILVGPSTERQRSPTTTVNGLCQASRHARHGTMFFLYVILMNPHESPLGRVLLSSHFFGRR